MMAIPSDGVDLSDAIMALRDALVEAMWDGQNSRVRFRLDPVELTIQAGVTKTGTGSAGVKWHVFSIGGEKKKESESTQTLKLRLAPVLFDDKGAELPLSEQLISDRITGEESTTQDQPTRERA